MTACCASIVLLKHPALQRKSHLCIPRKGRGLSLNFLNHVSVSDLYFPRIGPPIFLQQNRQTNRGNIEIAYKRMNVEIGAEATPRNSFYGNICFEFSELCVRSLTKILIPLLCQAGGCCPGAPQGGGHQGGQGGPSASPAGF